MMNIEQDQNFSPAAAEALLEGSQQECVRLSQRYRAWADKFGEDEATRMLGMLIAVMATSPATGTAEPERWIEGIKAFIDGYWFQYKLREGEKSGHEQQRH